MKKSNKSEYGILLTELIRINGISQQSFYNELGIGKPYIYDIVSGKANPPPPVTQLKILRILKPNDKNKKLLLEIAANERNEMPADILIYLKKYPKTIDEIRNSKNYIKFMDKGEI